MSFARLRMASVKTEVTKPVNFTSMHPWPPAEEPSGTFSNDEDEHPLDDKQLIFIKLTCSALVILNLSIFIVAVLFNGIDWEEAPVAISCVLQISFLIYLTIKGKPPKKERGVELLFGATAILLITVDLQTNGLLELWAALPLLICIMVVGGLPVYLLSSVTTLSLLYFIFESVRDAVSGLYWTQFTLIEEHVPYTLETSTSLLRLFVKMLSVLSAYALGHWHMNLIQYNNKVLQDTSELAEAVAESLCNFDLDHAAYLLKESRNRSRLIGSLSGLLDNLQEYRAYLPGYLIHVEPQAPTSSVPVGDFPKPSIVPPMGSVAIVFTDIQSSTSIWEQFPTAMEAGLVLHNECLRRLIAAYEGYEVKTMGDAFMASFTNCSQAIDFACSAQIDLMKQPWSRELSSHPACREVPGVWCGIRIRMGCHYGPCTVEQHPITGRTDYFGPTVNRAARIEASAVGGGICVSPEVAEEYSGVLEVSFVKAGELSLKGIDDLSTILLVVPKVLEARTSQLLSDWAERNKVQDTQVTEVNAIRRSLPMDSPNHLTPRAMIGGRLSNLDASTSKKAFSKSIGTVGTVHMLLSMFTGSDDFLASIFFALDRTEGVVQSLCGHSLIADWNIAKKCRSHLHQCFRFANFLNDLQFEYRCSKIHFGASTGKAIRGSVGTWRSKFIVVAGGSVLMSYAAVRCCDAAAAPMLYIEPVPNLSTSDLTLKRHLKLIDIWDGLASVFQITVGTSGTSNLCIWVTEASSPDKDALLEKNTISALTDRCPAAIEWLLINYANDPAITAMLGRISEFTTLEHPNLHAYMDSAFEGSTLDSSYVTKKSCSSDPPYFT
eukprot:TRINITY_DN20874_c0_g1_i2.p1 TRINITY_DN20874_c0_g1~~TRINITY_DN20874_c0_g1_i2.p1  ORF type:complete len:833 (+),score=87.35 TRINITY_DN20874_c0_g1_i2:68-2566(+)